MRTLRQAVERQREQGATIDDIGVRGLQEHYRPSHPGSTRALVARMLEGTTKNLPWAVILCRFRGSAPNPSVEESVERFYRGAFTPGTGGLVEYWKDVSLGCIDITGSRVFGWVEVDIPREAAGGAPPNGPGRKGLVDAAIRAVQATGGDPLKGFHSQISVYTENWSRDDPGRPSGIPAWTADDPLMPWWPTWIDGSADHRGKVNLTPPHNGNITAHEMGHGFSMHHDLSADLKTHYGDPCCIMSQNGPFVHPAWGLAFGPALCLPHLIQQDWMYKRRVYSDDGRWLAEPDGITLPLAPVGRLAARANQGIKLAYRHGDKSWDYYVEFATPTDWNQGVPGAPLVFIRRMATADGNVTPAYLGFLKPPVTAGTVSEFVETTGNVRFRVSVTDLPGPVLRLNATKL